MAYQILGNVVISQPIADTSTTQKEKLGRIVQAVDPTYGVGEFIYLTGVASTVVGSIVNYDAVWVTALHTSALDKPRPLAVAMSANVANQYGWYQISGQAVVVKDAALSLGVGEAIGASSGAAVVVATGSILNGMCVAALASATSSVTSVRVMINRPHDTSDVS
jgi:hypothetical protein